MDDHINCGEYHVFLGGRITLWSISLDRRKDHLNYKMCEQGRTRANGGPVQNKTLGPSYNNCQLQK